MEAAAAKIIADTHIESLTEAASWGPRWKVVANTCLVIENILVLVGLVLIFGRGYLGLNEVQEGGVLTITSNGSMWLTPPTSYASEEEEGLWSYAGGALVLFSRLVHTIGLLAAAQSRGHLQNLSTSKLTDLRHIQEDA